MTRLLLAACLCASSISASAQTPRLHIDLGCQPTDKELVYLCTVRLAEGMSRLVDGADLVVSADMPSMPMAHNVKPVPARPVAGKPGTYEARLELEMLGEWAVKLQFRAPRPDVVVRKLDFQKDRVTPVAAR
jgi:hypothetical protein